MKRRIFAVMTLGILIPSSLLYAQVVATDTAEAGPDFPFQGEFVGESVASGGARTPLAAQVSAWGSGSFRAVLYTGGLPGVPGHLASSRVQIMGTRSGEKVTLSGSSYALSITRTAITGTGPNQAAVNLPRIGRTSPTIGLKAPVGATVLFDGSRNLSAWRTGAKVDDRGLLGVPATTVASYGNYSLHLEFQLPFEPANRGQARGNSGIIMNTGGFSEIQVLDSFGDVPYMDGCAALFSTASPLFHAGLPPLAWQTYDINFTAPATTGDARVTVRHNGVVVQDQTILKNRRSTTTLELQDHQHPVFYRNIWIVSRADYDFAQHGITAIRPGERLMDRQPGRNPLNRAMLGEAANFGPTAIWNGVVHDFMGRSGLKRIAMPTAALLPEASTVP